MTPAWLQRAIGDVHRAAGLRTCPKCRGPLLVGLDDDICALTARAEPTPINAVGEALALLAGRRTFDLITAGGRKELHRREEWHIQTPRKYLVLAEHRCGASMAAHIETVPPKRRYVIPDEPPY